MNFYSELFELKNDTGELLFYLISIGLACATCFENGLMCGHMLNKLPHWKPIERQALISTILASNPDLADREQRGMVKSSRRYIYESAWVKAFAARPPYKFDYDPSVIWTAIDSAGPITFTQLISCIRLVVNCVLCSHSFLSFLFLILCAGGGSMSEFAVASLAYENSRHIVLHTHHIIKLCSLSS